MPFCHSLRSSISKVVSTRKSKATRKKKKKTTTRGKRRRNNLREKFIKNERPLNPTHISLKKERQLEIRITKRTIMMS